jgi:hypothetical protein
MTKHIVQLPNPDCLQQRCLSITKYRLDQVVYVSCFQRIICGSKENAVGSLG